MATDLPSSTPSDLPPNFDFARDSATGRTYYIDHAHETTSFIHPSLLDELPPNYDCRIDATSGKIYFIDHINKTTSWSHPCHEELHRSSDSDPELRYPYKQCLDGEGRHYYTNDENQTTSWLHPVKFAGLKATGILDGETDTYGEDGQAWKAWILEDIAECGLNKGTPYFVNYRAGDVDWQSPEHMMIAHQKALERRAVKEAV